MLAADLAAAQQTRWDVLRDLLGSYAGSLPVRTVAVVGNAPLEPNEERARRLDAAELVIRINSMILDEPGDPPCVGTRCHVVLLSRSTRMTRWVFQDYHRRAYLIPQAGFPQRYVLYDQPGFWPADLGALPIPNNVVTQRLVDRLDPDHLPNELIPTSGMLALYLAHEMFPDAELVATGFSFLDDSQQAEWAHHSGGSTTVNPLHELALEAELLRSWIADGSMRLLP